MKKTVIALIAASAFTASYAQKEVNYKDTKVETDYVTIQTMGAVSNDAYTKLKIKFTNKTNDYIIYKIEESKLIINGAELTPKERWLILEPNESGARVIDFKGTQFYTAKNYSLIVDGLYKVSLTGKGITAPDFKLPASQNEFKAGNFNCTLLSSSKKTDKTVAKFKCVYNGDKVGFISPAKVAVKMPDGNEYSITNSKVKPTMLMKGEDDGFVLVWEKMVDGKAMDMQLVDMTILWRDAFAESAAQKLKSVSIEMKDELNPNATSSANTAVIEKKQETSAANTQEEPDETSQYRGSGDPLKGLNVDKTNTIQVGNYYALIIGIDKYTGTWQPLKNGVKDAKAVETLIKEKYKMDFVKSLYDVQATRKNIITAMEWLAANVKEKDNVVIYYSGHGEYKKQLGKGYWVPVDAQTTSTSDYISNNDIQTFLEGIKSKHTLLVSDACFSGDIFRGNTISVPFENSERYYKEVHNLISRQALTSGGIEPVMDGGQEGHSVFAFYFLKALKNNQSKFFDASQLYSTIKIPVTNNSEQSPQFQSIKNTGDEGGQFIFIKK